MNNIWLNRTGFMPCFVVQARFRIVLKKTVHSERYLNLQIMPIRYRVIEKVLLPKAGRQEKKYYANTISSGEYSLDELIKDIEKSSTLSSADVHAVIYAMNDKLLTALADGKIVRLGVLGSMRIHISSRGETSPGNVGGHSIYSARYVFHPGSALKSLLKRLRFQKAD